MSKFYYSFSDDGYFLGKFPARLDPLESKKSKKNIYLLPKSSTFIKPPKEKPDKDIKWDGSSWILEDKKVEAKPSKEELFKIAKEGKLSQISIQRQFYQYSNITYKGREYLNNQNAQNKFFNLVNNIADLSKGIEWRLADGLWVAITHEEAKELINIIIDKETKSYKEESRLIDLINAAKNIKELEQITWTLSDA